MMLKLSSLAVTLLSLLAIAAGCTSIATQKVTSDAAESAPEIAIKPPSDRVSSPVLVAVNPDVAYDAIMQQYINSLGSQGYNGSNQGIWLQTDTTYLAGHQGTTPLPAASLTKVATTLAALQTWGPQHKFITIIGTTGTVQNGVLQGDLIVQGSADPFFVWENAILLGNKLNQLGIRAFLYEFRGRSPHFW
jgi:serine-type D-Ala-D-Ala carboxypeptidase/endopeptidase (penicillin-binding protein 4)